MVRRLGSLVLSTSLVVSSPMLAQSTAPVASDATATSPVNLPVKVLVLPLAEIGDGPARPWIGKAMHQSMLAELARARFVEPLAPEAAVEVQDAAAAAKAGNDAGAAYVVFGSYQVVDDDLRVTGQLIDASTGAVAGGLKATGNVRDLFGVEDILAAQLKRELAGAIQPMDDGSGIVAVNPEAAATQPAAVVTPTGPVATSDALPSRGYEGSELQKALRGDPSRAPMRDDAYDRYRYGEPTPSYYPDYGYRAPYGYNYYPYYPRTIVVVPGGTDGTGAGAPAQLPPNGNYNVSPSGGKDNRPIGGNYNKSPYPNVNTAPSGGAPRRSLGGNSNTAPSGGVNRAPTGGNTVTSGSGNTVSGDTGGNTNSGGVGSNSK